VAGICYGYSMRPFRRVRASATRVDGAVATESAPSCSEHFRSLPCGHDARTFILFQREQMRSSPVTRYSALPAAASRAEIIGWSAQTLMLGRDR